MLFTDSDIITADQIAVLDPECKAVAASEKPSIVLEGDNSIIRHTIDEAGNQLESKYQNFSGYLISPGINLNHAAAVMNILSTAINRPRMRLNQVVAVPPDPTKSALQRWLEAYALRNLYRAAFARFSKNEDRYQKKFEFWDSEAQTAWSRLISQGIPVVLQPLPCPGALREFGAGLFQDGAVTAGGSGSTDPGDRYGVAITWTGSAYVSPSNKNNAESAGSARVFVTTTAGQLLSVSISALTPPGATLPAVGTADNIYTQQAATGWNIYASGPGASGMYLQNASPIPVATKSFTLPDKPVLTGPILTAGQFPDYNFAFQNMLHRA